MLIEAFATVEESEEGYTKADSNNLLYNVV
jgi:hypothetical protein